MTRHRRGMTPGSGFATLVVLGLWIGPAAAVVQVRPSVARTTVRGTYYHMAAFHPFAGSTAIFAAGTTRGDLVDGRVDVALNRAVKAHVLYERLVPGSFYVGCRPGYFFRVEFTFTRVASIPLSR